MMLEQLNMLFPGQGDGALVIARADDGTIAGTVYVKRSGCAGEFVRLFVAEPYRRQGIATALIERAEGIARQAGCVSLACSVHPKNAAAKRLYHRLGFATAFQFADGDLLMARPIRPLAVVQSDAGFANDSASFCAGGAS